MGWGETWGQGEARRDHGWTGEDACPHGDVWMFHLYVCMIWYHQSKRRAPLTPRRARARRAPGPPGHEGINLNGARSVPGEGSGLTPHCARPLSRASTSNLWCRRASSSMCGTLGARKPFARTGEGVLGPAGPHSQPEGERNPKPTRTRQIDR